MTSPQGLAERILPARGAAQKATASFAEQLTDSPGRSDGESPTSANLFHEPTQRTKSVKYRYSATGKHLSSPLMGSPSSPERKPAKSKLKGLATPLPHVPNPKVAVATTSHKRKASPSGFRREDVLHAIFLSSPSPLSSAPTTPIVSTKDLPPSPVSIPDSPKRLPVSQSRSLRSLAPTTSNVSILSQPLSPKRKQKKSKMNSGPWVTGNAVWVLVNTSGVPADNGAHLDISGEFMWWPAQVVQKHPLCVSLFGDFPSSSSTSRGLCTIFTPSSSNVLSINDDSGAIRFSRTTFRLTALSANDNVSPPTKKARLDDTASIQAKWESAVQNMQKASTLEYEGLPAILSSYAVAGDSFYDSLDDSDPDMSDLRLSLREPTSSDQRESNSARKLKAQGSKANVKANVNRSTPRPWSPCPPDPTLQIPGELVLALAPKTGTFYWPARILEHVPARKEKYKVKFLDDEEHVVARDRFWTAEEEGFARCTLGEWESAVKTTDDPESEDEGGEFGIDDDATGRDSDDGASALPPPPPAGDFEHLSVRAQFAYVKPVLRAILNKEYVPAREKHDAFMKGGPARVALLKSAGVRGGMDTRFVKAVQKVICEWVLGDTGLKPQRLDVGEGVTGASGPEQGAGVTSSLGVAAAEALPRDSLEDDKMEDIESMVVLEDADKNEGALCSSTPDKGAQDSEMADDVQKQQPVSSNGITLSPVVQQASLAAKSQLDLLAEVSQAVATEPSLLPSHPEVPRLNVDLPLKDTSCQPSPLTPIPDESQELIPQRRGPVVCDEFEILSGVEKLDYCLNILLPESIQQLLLWRSGERTSSVLLLPEEEQKLHDVGVRKAAETDWVDDLMRLRAAQARLWGIDPSKKADPDIVLGGTRSRPRRGMVSRP